MATKKKKKAAKKKPAKRKSKPLFSVEQGERCIDGSGCIYRGHVGDRSIGTVVAKTKTDAKRKLLRAARSLLG